MNLSKLSTSPSTLDLGEYVLRPLQFSDVSAWYAYLSDPEVTRLTSYDIRSDKAVTAMIEEYIAGYAQKTSTRWAIAQKDTDTLIGTCGYYWWNASHSVAELGYDLSRNYWGKGVMTRAVQATIKWAFEILDINRIQATVMVDNFSSARVLEKNGFLQEGTLREYKISHGQPRDFWMFALLSKDYKRS
ncbi:MAG: GNAT family protein [Anaerolineales bacterium]